MHEYGSSTLVTAVQRALAEDGITAAAPPVNGALLPFEAKRRYLTGIAARHGLLPLLRVGRVLPRMGSDPAVSALLHAGTPLDLFERWGRLERFTHSRNRVVLAGTGEREIRARHAGPPGSPPEPAADALVLGALTELLRAIGLQEVTVTAGAATAGRPPVRVYADGAFTRPAHGADLAHWRFTWTAETRPPARPGGPTCPSQDPVSRARRLLDGDLGRRWSLDALAAGLGVSSRTLQRRLHPAGGFRGLIATARAEAAADLLMNSRHALCIVGFACGYTDQSHFTRDFKRRTAITPAAYRAAFTRTTRRSHAMKGTA
ncbi:helix-turn-helix transcriptional regulator [Streptomyces sp. NPDC048603]|uniref:helix-turn-helix transcriptional regulator n=1 Tax=Streptomyces sp. NPDC048603 TaxID=3365577 RepID=UPI00371CCB57